MKREREREREHGWLMTLVCETPIISHPVEENIQKRGERFIVKVSLALSTLTIDEVWADLQDSFPLTISRKTSSGWTPKR